MNIGLKHDLDLSFFFDFFFILISYFILKYIVKVFLPAKSPHTVVNKLSFLTFYTTHGYIKSCDTVKDKVPAAFTVFPMAVISAS